MEPTEVKKKKRVLTAKERYARACRDVYLGHVEVKTAEAGDKPRRRVSKKDMHNGVKFLIGG